MSKMRITFAEWHNFRSLKRARIDFTGAAALFVGMNGNGKSSLLNGIRMALFGRCELTDRAGRGGADDIVGDDGPEAKVRVGLECAKGAVVVEWAMDRAGETALDILDASGKPKFHGKQKDLRKRLAEWLDVNWLHAEAAADPATYLAGGELAPLLCELVGGEVTDERLRAAAGDRADALLAFAERAGVALKGTDDLQRLGAVAVAERKRVKKDIENRRQKLATLPEAEAPTAADGKTPLTPAMVPRMRAALEQLDAQLQDLLVEKGRVSAMPSEEALAAKKNELAQLVLRYRETIAENEKKLQELAARAPSQKDLDAALAGEADAETAKAKAETDLAVAKAAVERLGKWKDNCPTCFQRVDKDVRDRLAAEPNRVFAEAQHALRQAEAEHKKAKAVADKLRERRVEAATTKPGLEHILQDARAAVAQHEKALGELELQAAPRSEADIDAEVDGLRKRLLEGRAKLEALESIAERERLQGEVDALESDRRFLEWACDSLDKGELANKLMVDGAGAFEAACSAELEPFGLALTVQVNGRDADVMVGVPGGRKRRYRGLSKSERTLTQLAVASAYGKAGVVLLDDLDGLDAERKPVLFRALRTAQERFGTLALAAAWGAGKADPDGLAAALVPTQVVWVGNGTVTTPAAPAREDAA